MAYLEQWKQLQQKEANEGTLNQHLITLGKDSRGSLASLGSLVAHILKACRENVRKGDIASRLTAEQQTRCQSTT